MTQGMHWALGDAGERGLRLGPRNNPCSRGLVRFRAKTFISSIHIHITYSKKQPQRYHSLAHSLTATWRDVARAAGKEGAQGDEELCRM